MLSPDSPISAIPLSTRERSLLHMLGVSTVADFLQFNLRQVADLPDYGSATFAALERKRAVLAHLNSKCEDDADNGDRSFLDEGLWFLGLSRRGEAALRELNVRTVRDFLSLDVSLVGDLRGCGATTQQELTEVQKQFGGPAVPEVRLQQDEAAQYAAKQPMSQNSWRKLPLFFDWPIPGLAAGDLHPTYHPDRPVEQLDLSKRVKRAIADKRITSLGELLLTPGAALTETKGLSKYTLDQVRANVEEYLTYWLGDTPQTKVNWATPDGLLLSLLEPIITDERQRRVLLERMGWQSKPRTLLEIGRECGRSREWIRQIEKKGLCKLMHWRAAATLQPFHDVICTMLKDISPLMSLKAMCRQLQRQFAWNRPLHEKALAKLLPAFRDLRCVEGRYVRAANMPCVDCPLLPTALETILLSRRPERISLSALAPFLFEHASIAEECPKCPGRPERTSVDLVRLAFSRSAVASRQYHILDNDQRETSDEETLVDDAMLVLREAKASPLPAKS